MTRKITLKIKRFAAVALSVAVAIVISGCDDDSDLIQDQRTAILNYLQTNLRLEESDYTVHNGVYRYIAGNTLPEAEQVDLPVLEKGDEFAFYYEAYTFPRAANAYPYTTNRQEKVAPGTSMGPWNFEPKRVKLGSGEIIKSLEDALPDCELGDSVLLFMTSDRLYGDRAMGMLPRDTPVQYVITIENINKEL